MTDRIVFDVTGIGELAAALAGAPERVADGAHEAGKTVGRSMLSYAKAGAPRDRPWLATKGVRLKSWRDRRGNHSDVFTIPDNRGRPVGFFVEYGTARTPPQPFLRPALAKAAPEFLAAVIANAEVFE